MKSRLLFTALLALLSTAGCAHAASFDYHGTLQDAGMPAEGSYDIELTLYSAADGGRVIGGPLVLYKVPVHAGAFNTRADFGPQTNALDQAWLGVKVRDAGSGEFAALSARSAVAAEATASVCPGAWTLGGNAGNPAGSYLGTADAQPLVFKVNGVQVGQITPSGQSLEADAANVMLGSAANQLGTGTSAVGNTVSGGGTSYPTCGPSNNQPCYNASTGGFATVGGGAGNVASGGSASVGGGGSNTANGSNSTVSGGVHNNAGGIYSTVGGGDNNIAGGVSAGAGATVSGGESNSALADDATVAGGINNQAGGTYSFAAGSNAHVRAAGESGANATDGDFGTFVWADDSSSSNFASTGPNQFLVRATGGVGINGPPLDSDVELTITGNSASNPSADLALESYGAAGFYAIDLTANGHLFSIYQYDGGGYTPELQIYANSDMHLNTGSLYLDGAAATATKPGGGPWSAPSDARLKRDIQPLDHMLDRLLQLHGVSFEFAKPDAGLHPAGRHTGFIAQEVQQVFPDWVGQTPDGYLSVGPTGFEAMTVEALRELRAEKDDEVAELRDENTQLHAQLDDVLARLAKIETGKGN